VSNEPWGRGHILLEMRTMGHNASLEATERTDFHCNYGVNRVKSAK